MPQVLEELIDAFSSYGWYDLAWSLLIVAVAIVLGRVGASLVLRALSRWSGRTETVVDDAIVEHLSRPLKWLLPIVAARLVIGFTSVPEGVQDVLRHTLLLAAIVGVGWVALRAVTVIQVVVESKFEMQGADNLQARSVHTQMRGFRNIAGFVITVCTIAFGLMTFEPVRQLGAGLLASAGVAGIVLGFAAQRSIATVVGGIQIALAQPIRVDDVVIVEGEWGRIEEITLTYVVVRIWDLRRLIVPVTYFLERPFQNWTRVSSDLLGTVELRVDYSLPLDPLRAEFKRILEASPLWDHKVAVVQVTDTNDKTMLVRPLMSATDAGKLWDLRCEVREKLIAFLQREYPGALPRLRADIQHREVRD